MFTEFTEDMAAVHINPHKDWSGALIDEKSCRQCVLVGARAVLIGGMSPSLLPALMREVRISTGGEQPHEDALMHINAILKIGPDEYRKQSTAAYARVADKLLAKGALPPPRVVLDESRYVSEAIAFGFEL